MTFYLLGTVEGEHEPGARIVAMKHWPLLAVAAWADGYRSGRLHLHRADATSCHCGQPQRPTVGGDS